MIDILVSDRIREVCPAFVGCAIYAEVDNSEYNASLWKEIDSFSNDYLKKYTKDSIKDIPQIMATRQVYKLLGKDPSRYRPSSEALCRRILKGQGLYKVDTLVDLINLVSLASGYSIGGFDYDKIDGDKLVLGVGTKDEPYEGIGRGVLNIEGLPVYRDSIGGIGTPTSDNERTKINLSTTRILTIINAYSGENGLLESVEMMKSLLERYASARNIEIKYFR